MLKKIGVHLTEHALEGKMDHKLDDMRQHCKAVSGNVQPIPDSVLDHVPCGPVADWLGDIPSPQQIRAAVRKLKDCAPGRDEVSAGLLHWAGPRTMDCIISLVQTMWVTHPEQWSTTVK